MKKFKLIKEYPHSPELGTIITKIDTYWGYPNGHDSNRVVFLSKDKPEDHPEYWEEVVEKDYEILSFVNNGSANGKKGFVVPLQKDGLYYAKGYPKAPNDPDESLEGRLEKSFLDIHSVKRLSDGEIFTVGDNIECENSKGKITMLEIYGNDIYLHGIDNEMPFGYTLCDPLDCLEIPQKVKRPLFTTEDGVDIFEGDEFYWLDKGLNINNSGYSTDKGFPHITLYFSTKEKAEEYIKLNSIRYSLKDIKEAFGESRTLSFKSIFNKLKQ